jgi:hypothetical protein
MNFDEWFESKYPERVYGRAAEVSAMRDEYREVWEEAQKALRESSNQPS